MDRLTRSLAFCGFGLVLTLTASGCRMTRPEVPPGRPYAKDGRQRQAIDFSSDGHPVNGAATTNMMPDSSGGKLAQGIGTGATRPDVSPLLGGTGGSFGPPGTGGRSTARESTAPGDDSLLPAGSAPLPRPSIEPSPDSSPSSPTTLPPDAEPKPEIAPPPSQTVQPSPNASSRMGGNNGFPSPM